MKKKYYFISIIIILLTFSMIAFLVNIFDSVQKKEDKTSYADTKNNIESIEYYLYENCDETKETKYIKMDYFMINDYFLLSDEFVDVVKFIDDNKNILLKNNRCKVKDSCKDSNVKKIVINMDDQSLYVLNNMCNDNQVNELINSLEKTLANLLNKKEEEHKKYIDSPSLSAFKASKIAKVEYNYHFPWIRDNALDGYKLLINNNSASFSNQSTYYSLYKENYEINNTNWNSLLNYLEKNISSIDNPKFPTCMDGGESSVVVTLKDGQNYTINAYCGGTESFKKLYDVIDKTVGEGIIAKYEENVRKYDMASEVIKSPITTIMIVEETGTIEMGFIIDNMMITFYQKEYAPNNKVKNNKTKSFNISSNEWNAIVSYLNENTIKDNKGYLEKKVIVQREDGNEYSSDDYSKFYNANTYDKIIEIIGESKFTNYKNTFFKEMGN